MDKVNVKIKPLYDWTKLPTYGSDKAAGADLYAGKSTTIAPHTTEKIGAGFAMAIPDGYVGLIFARSGLATKQGLRPANCVGVIDSDYRGEVIVGLHNDTNDFRIIDEEDRIAQLMVLPYPEMIFDITDELDETERGTGGFGSTGV